VVKDDQQDAWQPLSILRARFRANCAALATREPALAHRLRSLAPAAAYAMRFTDDDVIVGRRTPDGGVDVVPSAVSPAAAANAAKQAYPRATYDRAMLVAGIDKGWLWHALYELEPKDPMRPGHRPPLFLLAADLEQLWVALHIHDWQRMLADPRVRLFVGDDAADQWARSLTADCLTTWPKLAFTVDARLWAGRPNFDATLVTAHAQLSGRLVEVRRGLAAAYAWATPAAIAERLRAGGPLRVLGLTSRYTTFLQYSMRDWLAGFEALGHEARIVMEPSDYGTTTNLTYAEACLDFRPDVILLIDHYRAESNGLPPGPPCIMYVQDRMPSIFNDRAGSLQGPHDFCVGFGRVHLSRKHGYPADRFLAAPVGINPDRFAAREPIADELARFACDVSYVSHASVPAERLVEEQCLHADAAAQRFLWDMFDRMRAHYAADLRMLGDVALRRMIARSTAATDASIEPEAMPGITEFLMQRVNSALVRHQTLEWVAALDIDLRLYGRGWEAHPTLGRFARGVADNQTELGAIYRSSRINLQVTPFGCVHQRMLDGLTAGGFFLARWSQGDAMGRAYQQIWAWCERAGIHNDAEMRRRADAATAALVAHIDHLHGYDTRTYDAPLYDLIRAAADGDFMISADSIWGADYDAISFATAGECAARIGQYLYAPAARRDVATRMRTAVIDRCSYRAISARLLDLVARQMETLGDPVPREVAA